MAVSIEKQIIIKIKKAKGGSLFFIDNFASIANAKSVNKALERLAKSGELHRVATGIYVRPKKDTVLGIVFPSIDEIAVAIAKRDKARIIPTGSYAMYKLGLTTQVPLNVVYYTDASSRKIKIGKQTITFKKASSKNVAAIGDISKLVIQALKTIGKDNVKEEEIQKIRELLKNEKPYHLQHDLKLAPEWIKKQIGSINPDITNE
jgi:predicted transcriptional regulator of viral defense system